MTFRLIIALGATLGLSACVTNDTAMRNAPVVQPTFTEAAASAVQATPLAVQKITVRVPDILTVSEANTYKPRADIVWREDPFGDRHEQVRVIVQDAANRAAAQHISGRAVVIDIQMTKFHAVTEKTRYTIGGTHELNYIITAYDAATGQRLTEPQLVEQELKAYGGARALEAMSRGQTQKVRITDFLTNDFDDALSTMVLPVDPAALIAAR